MRLIRLTDEEHIHAPLTPKPGTRLINPTYDEHIRTVNMIEIA